MNNEFRDLIYVECKATIQCAGCGMVDDADGDSERAAVNSLVTSLACEGWGFQGDSQPFCGQCMREAIEEQQRLEEATQRAEAEEQAAALTYFI